MLAVKEKPVSIQPVHEEDCGCPLCRIYRYPNAETLEAMAELENGGGRVFTGTTKDFISMILSESDDD